MRNVDPSAEKFKAAEETSAPDDTKPILNGSAKKQQRALPTDRQLTCEDFYCYMPMPNAYIFIPTREIWPASSVNARVLAVDKVKASDWLGSNRPIDQMTWVPGLPTVIQGRVIAGGSWIERQNSACFNLYRPPTIKLGQATKAGRWLDHIKRIYPEDANHLVCWFAQRVQHPEIKINHAIVLGGYQGIGKDTMVDPVKQAIGPWNFEEVSPQLMLRRFNGYLKSVILRVSEARDLGDVNRYQFYDHLKAYTASPPDVLRVDEKHLREYPILNCVGLILTTNHKADGIFLPEDDRRHYVAWSTAKKEEFSEDYWNEIWAWYKAEGYGHVAAYLNELDLSSFDPKRPPPKTEAFWAIVNANRAPENSELADILDRIGKPAAITLGRIQGEAYGTGFGTWLTDPKNRRAIPHRFEECGYTIVRNPDAKDGYWKIGAARQSAYADAALPVRDQILAVRKLCGHPNNPIGDHHG